MKGNHGVKIDLLELYSKGNTDEWNAFLATCLRTGNLHALERALYGVQLGMDDLVKRYLNTEKICIWFIRIQRSIERTMRDIIRARNPNPLDNPLNSDSFPSASTSKKTRDLEIETYLRKIRH